MANRSGRTDWRRRSDHRAVNVNFITAATRDNDGRFRVHTRGRSVPTVLPSVGNTPAADQAAASLLDSLHINGGTWTSIETLRTQIRNIDGFLRWLCSTHGIVDLRDEALTPATVWQGVLSAGCVGSMRSLRPSLVQILLAVRDDGELYNNVLFGHFLRTVPSKVEGYAPAISAEIERIARIRVGEWYRRHRAAVESVLGGLPRDWLDVDVSLLLPDKPQGCPEEFAVNRFDLAAAMVLLALADDKGPNLSVIRSYTCDSLERANDEAGFVSGVKARNREVMRTPSPAGGIYSYGGLLEFVTAATRVDRFYRTQTNDFGRLLFVPTSGSRVLGLKQVQAWWRGNSFLWDEPSAPAPETLSFQRLRKGALLRAKHKGYGIIGQKSATARLYLADALPEVILIPGLLETQGSMARYWRSMTSDVSGRAAEDPTMTSPGSKGKTIRRLLAAEAVMDVGVAACASNGQSPTDERSPCGLGPVACFVCPNGFRTPEIIPGLIAAVEFTENVQKYEPEEWLNGEAAILNQLARKSLEQFPSSLVAAVSAEQVANSRALIACVYLEGRSDG
jgi:hypothetical protein